LQGVSIFGNPFESELLLETFVNLHDKKICSFLSHEKIMNVDGGFIELNKDLGLLPKEILGRGQYGEVIKGILFNTTKCAVKKRILDKNLKNLLSEVKI
jgi:hypothetical protein